MVDMTRFYVIRHCEALGNRERKFQGTYDGDVSELGKKQLEYLSLRMRNEKVDFIYSSSRKRALKTAQAVQKYHNADIRVDDAVIEINAGDWEGKSFADFPRLYPRESYLWDNEPYNFIAPNGESMRSVYARMSDFVKKKTVEHSGKCVVIASHGCAIRNLMCWAKNLSIENINSIDWYGNTAINIIDVDENLQPHIVLENDMSHLPDEIRKISKQNWSNEDKK